MTVPSVAQSGTANEPPQRRTTSGRAVRANTMKQVNYYARSLGPANTTSAGNSARVEEQESEPPGFFPAIQYFSDAITALPKEVIRQITLMKEVEAKIYGLSEDLGQVLDEVMRYPVPPKKTVNNNGSADEQGLMRFTANNSAASSARASLINGFPPSASQFSAQNSVPGSIDGDGAAQRGGEGDWARRHKFRELRMLTHNLLGNLDEKNILLAATNRVLSQQLLRIDSVMPHVDNEISEEARLGSMTHWAYADNRQKKQAGNGFGTSRRDVAATNVLAAAANATHESDIAAARRDATRETKSERHKGKAKEHVDSDFDDKPKKTQPKSGKGKGTGQPAGLGILNPSDPVKKPRVQKAAAAPAMERSMSSMSKVSKVPRETSRSSPAVDGARKATKAKPAPISAKRKGLNSAQASPAMASSPSRSTFSAVDQAPPPNGRPQSARYRTNSTTNLRHERNMDGDDAQPPNSGMVNVQKTNGKRKSQEENDDDTEREQTKRTTEQQEGRDIEASAHDGQIVSGSNSGKAGRGSTAGTPRTENFSDVPSIQGARSMRSMRGNNRDESSSEPQNQGGPSKRHKRDFSNSHLVKQLAPFNRSPDMEHDEGDDASRGHAHDGQELRPDEVLEQEENPQSALSSPKRRPLSRRNTSIPLPQMSSPPASSQGGNSDAAMRNNDEAIPENPPQIQPISAPRLGTLLDDEDINDDSASVSASDLGGDPDDPNEQAYCYCNRGSYGEMIACDNEQCAREWFHLQCTGLREPPDEDVKWYCEECGPLFVKGKGGKGKGAGVKK